jgi:hypothetical protein
MVHALKMQLMEKNGYGNPDGCQNCGDAETLAHGATICLVGRMAARALDMFTQMLMARLLGVTAFGLYAIGWT